MEANKLVARLETRLKVIARIGQQARAKVLSQKERLKQRLIPA